VKRLIPSAILLSILIAFVVAAVPPQDAPPPKSSDRVTVYPNGCAILASEVTADLRSHGLAAKVLSFQWRDKNTNETGGHAVAVWQLFRGGPVCVYDHYFFNCTVTFLGVHTLRIDVVSQAIQEYLPDLEISDFAYNQ
jgi:hypothetical protein